MSFDSSQLLNWITSLETNGVKTHEFWYLQLKTLQMPDLVFFIIESMFFRLDQVFFKAKTIYYDK